MALYEYRIEAFNARGDDQYLDRFAQRLEVLFDRGWSVIERSKDTASPGWWRVELFKEDHHRKEDGVQAI
jgi:hypothetical protein